MQSRCKKKEERNLLYWLVKTRRPGRNAAVEGINLDGVLVELPLRVGKKAWET